MKSLIKYLLLFFIVQSCDNLCVNNINKKEEQNIGWEAIRRTDSIEIFNHSIQHKVSAISFFLGDLHCKIQNPCQLTNNLNGAVNLNLGNDSLVLITQELYEPAFLCLFTKQNDNYNLEKKINLDSLIEKVFKPTNKYKKLQRLSNYYRFKFVFNQISDKARIGVLVTSNCTLEDYHNMFSEFAEINTIPGLFFEFQNFNFMKYYLVENQFLDMQLPSNLAYYLSGNNEVILPGQNYSKFFPRDTSSNKELKLNYPNCAFYDLYDSKKKSWSILINKSLNDSSYIDNFFAIKSEGEKDTFFIKKEFSEYIVRYSENPISWGSPQWKLFDDKLYAIAFNSLFYFDLKSGNIHRYEIANLGKSLLYSIGFIDNNIIVILAKQYADDDDFASNFYNNNFDSFITIPNN